jgi:hypothetical protein
MPRRIVRAVKREGGRENRQNLICKWAEQTKVTFDDPMIIQTLFLLRDKR